MGSDRMHGQIGLANGLRHVVQFCRVSHVMLLLVTRYVASDDEVQSRGAVMGAPPPPLLPSSLAVSLHALFYLSSHGG